MSGEHAHPDLADQGASLHADLVAMAGRVATLEAAQAATDAVTRSLLARVATLEAAPPPGPVEPPQQPMRPIRFATLDDARSVLDLPDDANYVTWDHGDADLETVLAALGANDILVLPERDQPYQVDTSKGFRVPSNVVRVDGVTWPLTKGRGWFSMARGRRGLLGLGPRSIIELAPSGFTQAPQPKPPRYWYDAQGKASSITGAQESIIDFGGTAAVYVGNVTFRGRDLGGVAYNAVKTGSAPLTVERVWFDAAHRGFAGVPNGETGAVCVNGPLTMRHVEVDAGGVGTSPVMLNRSSGSLLEDCWFHDARIGMPTWWECYGEHVWRRVVSEDNELGINIESCGADRQKVWRGFHLLAEDSAFLNPLKVDGAAPSRHLNMSSPYGSLRVELVRCRVEGGLVPGSVVVQLYGTPMQQADADITATKPDGTPWPVRIYR